MLGYALVFLLLALITAALLGFGVGGPVLAGAPHILFLVFIAFYAVSLVSSLSRRGHR